jgi:hypothetical protein
MTTTHARAVFLTYEGLPRRTVDPRTVGKTYTASDGKTLRSSLFLTLTCRSYGKVTSDGTPGRPRQPSTATVGFDVP